MSFNLHIKPSRRQLAGIGAGALVAAHGVPALARPSPSLDLGNVSRAREAAVAFLGGLDPVLTQRTRFPLNGDNWRRWNYFGITGYNKPGLRLEEMTAAQKELAWKLAGAVLSPTGITKARNVMLNQEILREQGNGVNERGGEKFSFSIFGEPARTGDWAFRIEGHHLSLSYSFSNDRLVAITPSSFSSSPNRVTTGRHAGLVTLTTEDRLARTLAADLTGAMRSRANVFQRPYGNILTSAGRENSLTKQEGTPVMDLSPSQQQRALEVMFAFATEHLVGDAAQAIGALIKQETNRMHFGFAGSTKPDEALYYRFHSPRVVIEFASVDSEAQHLHTIVHIT